MSHEQDKQKTINAREQARKDRKLEETPLSQIVLHVMYRNRFGLVVIYATVVTALLIVRTFR